MKYIFYLLAIKITFLSCNNNEQSPVANNQDTVTISRHDQTGDTTVSPKKNQPVVGEMDTDELNDILTEYVSRYRSDFSFDSTFKSGKDTFEIRFRHYCLMDSAIVVPGRYVEMYHLDSFLTHNFESSLILVKNQDTIVREKFGKARFKSLLESPIREYGVLQPRPYIYLLKDAVEINYSISIPLTDLGKGVTGIVGFDGRISFKDRF